MHQIVLPIHFGYSGEVTGSQANELLPIVSDPNVSMHEGKAFTCQVQKGRLTHPSDSPSVDGGPAAAARANAGNASRRPSRKGEQHEYQFDGPAPEHAADSSPAYSEGMTIAPPPPAAGTDGLLHR